MYHFPYSPFPPTIIQTSMPKWHLHNLGGGGTAVTMQEEFHLITSKKDETEI